MALITLTMLLAGRAWAGRVNFAKYQAVTASGQNSTYNPELAVDGLVSNFHSYQTNNTNAPHWLEVTFPRAVTIASAHLYLGLDNDPAQGLQSFKLQYHNGAGWADVPGSIVTGNTDTELAVIFSFACTSARFRLYSDANGSRVIREMALFPPNLVGAAEQGYPIGTDVCLNLAYKRPTTASSIRVNEYAKRAVDGYVDDLSRWQCDGTSPGDTLVIDLLEDHVVASAHVHSGSGTTPISNPAQNFVLDHWDGAAWQPITGATVAANTNPSLAIPFSTPVTTSKIRYRTTSGNYARIRELLLFPPRAGGYPLGQDVEVKPPPTAKWDDFSDSSHRVRCGITDGRFLGYDNNAVRFSAGTLDRDTLGWQLLLNHRDGSYRIRHNATGRCLALSQIAFTDNNPVVLEDYTGMPHQDWFLEWLDATYFRIVNCYSGMALQTRYGDWTFGNQMAVRPINGTDIQRWRTQDVILHPKKGIAATQGNPVPWGTATWMEDSWQKLNGPTNSWSYSWGRQTSDTFPFMTTRHSFNPMQWGNFNWSHGSAAGPLDLIRNDLNSNPKPAHLMGFNEPDGADQANMTVDAAIERWPRLEALDAPLVAPCPANIKTGTWLPDWVTKADARGYRRDYTPYHWYAAPNAGQMISDLQQAYNTYGRPIWLTEFSPISWDGSGSWTKGDNFNFLAEFLWRAESLSWLKRYSVFQFTQGSGGGTDNATAPRGNTRNSDGSLTAYGQLYAGWDGFTGVVNDKAYHLHNRGTYKRVQNPVSTDTVASVDPDASAAATQWFLIPGTTAGTVRICSTLDGRRLRFYTGTGGYVGLAANNNTQLQTEWRYVPDQYGWYFIEHPNTNQRLYINGSGALAVGAITNTGDSYKWRFVVPATPEPFSLPAVPATPTATTSTTAIALSWPAVPGAVSYTVHRSTTSGGPWQLMIYGLTSTSWTNTGLPYETQYFYTVSATNALGSSSPSVPASATTLHPFASYATWQEQELGAFPPLDQAPGADAENDGLRNLLEFAFLTDPALPNGSSFRVNGTAPNTITLEFPWNWRASGLTWRLRHGSDLTNTAAWPVVAPGATTIIREGDIDRITVSPAMAHPGRGFYVLEVIGN